MEKFIIMKDTIKKVRRFNLHGRSLEFKIKPIPEGAEPVSWVKDAIDQIVQKAIQEIHPQDQVGFSFCSKEFKGGDGWSRFQEAGKVTTDDIWDIISSIYQSNSKGLNTETFCLGVTSVRLPKGKGKVRKYNSFAEECAKRRGIVAIRNNDNLCMPRALVVAIAHVNKDPDFRRIKDDVKKIQTQKALKLMEDAEVIITGEGAGIPELQKFQRYLKDYRIVVYQYGSKGRDLVFHGGNAGKNLNLLYHDGHFNTILSLTSAFCCVYYCEDCHVPYDHKDKHRCGRTCPGCLQSPACTIATKIKCTDCQRSFRGQQCFENHKKQESVEGGTVCQKIKICNECLKVIKTNRAHTCDETYCKICNTHVPKNHFCYIQPDKNAPKLKDTLYVFYDLEARQETVLKDGSHLHEPNLCVFKQCCDICLDTELDTALCEKCGVRQQVVKSIDPISPFLHHILTMRKKFKNVVVIAHNGQAYDHQFILNHILTETDIKPELIMRGTKILLMTVGNIKFLDSLNYFPMALAKLPDAFGLNGTFKKGYFPHLFNTKENANYVGPLPSTNYYDPDNMKENDRATFLKWYDENKGREFDMQKEIIEYCVSDVKILTAACLKFRQQLIDTGNVCPFTEACTIASACNKVFRRNFLKPNTIGIIPKKGYRWLDNQSEIATQWLVWEEERRGRSITHAAKEREIVIKGVKVDGYCSNTNEIFEFHGCYFHGCPNCFKHNRDAPLYENPSETLNWRYESTVTKSDRLREFGYTVIEIWECQFRQQLRDNEEILSYTKNHPLLSATPLNPRDAFYGGRTGNTRTYYQVKGDEKIKYVDVCSLYPWVCKYGKFPIGHPEVYVGKDCNMEQTEGLIKCTILPPEGLYHPVLPVKMNNKLMFTLCRSCGEKMQQSDCQHNDEERALFGTWVIDEVRKALEKGYKMVKIDEIWHYNKIEKYDRLNKIGGLFTKMINRFIKVKHEASGWPADCVTDEEKTQYVEHFLAMEDVQLDFTEITENPGLRSLAKLILNSFWGKFGQRENQPKTKIINKPEEFFGMLTDPAIIVNTVLPINENTLVVNYEFTDEAADQVPVVNVCIASYVTSQARLKLYSYLDLLGDRVLYYDTDSVIYISRNGEYDVPTGQCIGDMTDELEVFGAGSFITEFVSGGPKNYAYKVWSTKQNEEYVACKVKGISLNYNVSKLVNFNEIKKMVLANSEPIPIVTKNIRRTSEYQVITKDVTKLYKPNSTKRIFMNDGDSTPFGYKKLKTE